MMNVQATFCGGIRISPFPFGILADANGADVSQNLRHAIDKSNSHAKATYGLKFESIWFQDYNKYPSENVAHYLKEEQTITIRFKDGTFANIGNISLITIDRKLKNSLEISSEINNLIDDDPRYDLMPDLQSNDDNPVF